MKARLNLLTLFCCMMVVGTAGAQDAGSARLKDLVLLEGAAPVQLMGYGLVVGLDRTGDRARGVRGAPYTVQSIANMLRRFGVNVSPELLASRNAAAVMVSATMTAFNGQGSTLDVTVSALGDARSLSGGVLLQTPLINTLTNEVHAMGQGPISTGAILASSLGSSVRVNHSNTGRIPNGALVTGGLDPQLTASTQLGLVLKRPDFTNAQRISEVINQQLPGASATVNHAGKISVDITGVASGPNGFLASMEDLEIDVDVPARVVINERTGTIVAGGSVRLNEVMVTYGSIVISTQEDPYVSQPAPLSAGQTVSGTVGSASIEEETTRSVVLPSNTNVSQLATALNDLGLTARDVIAIFQAIDRAGALQGELIIL
ncbi:MAG TPA: flagellar basal body P-ring protein FlgI [Rhodothermales bacterium]|nr:flagellar basal body P-ring protein FlgI [Rhodothermales bacterium]